MEVEEQDSRLLFDAITLKLQFFMNLKLDSCIAIKKYCLLERGRQSMIEKKIRVMITIDLKYETKCSPKANEPRLSPV